MNLLTAGVTQGLVGASFYLKSSDVSMVIYQQEAKKPKGDEGVMKRSLGYATTALNQADQAGDAAEEALGEAQETAKAKAKAEDEKALEKRRRQEAARRTETAQEITGQTATAPAIAVAPVPETVSEIKIYTPQGTSQVIAPPQLSVQV